MPEPRRLHGRLPAPRAAGLRRRFGDLDGNGNAQLPHGAVLRQVGGRLARRAERRGRRALHRALRAGRRWRPGLERILCHHALAGLPDVRRSAAARAGLARDQEVAGIHRDEDGRRPLAALRGDRLRGLARVELSRRLGAAGAEAGQGPRRRPLDSLFQQLLPRLLPANCRQDRPRRGRRGAGRDLRETGGRARRPAPRPIPESRRRHLCQRRADLPGDAAVVRHHPAGYCAAGHGRAEARYHPNPRGPLEHGDARQLFPDQVPDQRAAQRPFDADAHQGGFPQFWTHDPQRRDHDLGRMGRRQLADSQHDDLHRTVVHRGAGGHPLR